MTSKEVKQLKKGDRVFWSNPNPEADPECGGVVMDAVRSQVQIVWDDGKACIIRVDEGLGDFWKHVSREQA